MNEEERQLEHSISEFRSYYEFSFKSLMKALNDANISHYSSGCGTKRVTFEIFPAASYVEELLRMLSIKRAFKIKTNNGFRDATSKADYNPAQDFIMYMRRWSLFAEQAMRTEGASERGVAAARAKLIMHDLIESLSEGKNGLGLRTTHLAKLMFAIGKYLESRTREEVESEHKANALQARANYLEAMDAAQGMLNRPKQHMLRASAS